MIETKVRLVGDITIVDIKGKITLGEGSVDLRNTIKNLKEKGQIKVILNLANTEYIDRSGIGELVSGFTTMSSVGGSLKLMFLTKRLHDLLQITKLYTVFEIFDNEEEALASFNK